MLNKKGKEAAETKNWYADRYQYVLVQRNILVLITLFALLCALGAAFSISYLAPLKSIEPFVIQVDQKTGITQVVKSQTVKELTANEAVNNYFMVLYIRSRESYGVADAINYNNIRVMSTPDVFRQYAQSISPNNQESPKNTLGDRATRKVKIGTITLLSKTTDTSDGADLLRFQVRVLVNDTYYDGRQAKAYYRLVTLQFKYVELALVTEDRYLNPLGFRVVNYAIEEDALNR